MLKNLAGIEQNGYAAMMVGFPGHWSRVMQKTTNQPGKTAC